MFAFNKVSFWVGFFLIMIVWILFSELVLIPHHVDVGYRFLIGFTIGLLYNHLYNRYAFKEKNK